MRAGGKQKREDLLRRHAAAVAVDLHDVFAGVAFWCAHDGKEHLVDRPVPLHDIAVMQRMRRHLLHARALFPAPEDAVRDLTGFVSAHADDADPGRRRAAGYRRDRPLFIQHLTLS